MARDGNSSDIRRLVRPGPLIFASLLAAGMAIYAWSVLATSRSTVDWLLILPAAVAGIAALIWSGLADLLADRTRAASASGGALVPVALLVLIALYASSLAFVGFDVATAIFIALALLIQGERRPLLVVGNAVLGTALLVWIFADLLSVRMPTLLL